MNNISTKIMLLRKQKGMSQSELAQKLNVSNKLISKWETGRSVPATEYLSKLCEIFDISIDDLIGNKADTNHNKTKFNIKLIAIITCSVMLASILIPVLHLAIAPIIFKKLYVHDIDKHIERNFDGKFFDLTTVIEVDDVPTKINQYGYFSKGEVEYIEYVDDEVEVVIKDGVKYDASSNTREIFDNTQVDELFDLYDITSVDDVNLSYFVEDTSFVDYIYKQFNGYHFELKKDIVNKFIAKELDSEMRVTSKIKCDADFKNRRLKKMTMEFKAKIDNEPMSVKVTETFHFIKKRKQVNHIAQIESIPWANLEEITLDDYIDDVNVSTISFTPSHLYENDDYFMRYTSNYIYLYNKNLELVNSVELPKQTYPSTYFNVVGNYIYCYCLAGYNVLNLNTLKWITIPIKYDIINISPLQIVYFYDEKYETYRGYVVLDGYYQTFDGKYMGHDNNYGVYTYITEETNGYDIGLYKYYHGGTYTLINKNISQYAFYNPYNKLSNYIISSGYVLNTNTDQIKKVTGNFDPYHIINNINQIFFTTRTNYGKVVGNEITNFDKLNKPPIRITNKFSHVVANNEFYFMLDSTNDKLYKVKKSFISNLANW